MAILSKYYILSSLNSAYATAANKTTGSQPATAGFIIPLSPAEVSMETIHQNVKPIAMAATILRSLLERFKAIAKGIPKRHMITVAKGAANLEWKKVSSWKVVSPLAFKNLMRLIKSLMLR